jgi:two-component system sensor histidine kinase TctE
VTVDLRRWGQGSTLRVSDNGPGLDQRRLPLLTQRWVQGQQGHELGQGAGLGLAIVRRYAELLGADFALEAAPGGGLCASLRFASRPSIEGTSASAA